ncbi:Hz112-like protein [Clanis bilineata nucleopolyhedrovirus]|uniref:Hz112-like protein n=1 Tax=Clanis bilineata nucleopolyhedrovirus TaxID=1307957 RepID=Q0N3Z9_9ABAC|nr:Hz112-like protein [Clanis bilineata nucleopolyhedrovirus]ABF47444.1 Hz112-like protein [Clanis bilineata nucleopolyhedrovirus]
MNQSWSCSSTTYKDLVEKAKNKNVVTRLLERELGVKNLNRMETSLAIGRTGYIQLTKGKKLDTNHRMCPSLYEADSVDFKTSLYKSCAVVKRCVACLRLTHHLLDIKENMCTFCRRTL